MITKSRIVVVRRARVSCMMSLHISGRELRSPSVLYPHYNKLYNCGLGWRAKDKFIEKKTTKELQVTL